MKKLSTLISVLFLINISSFAAGGISSGGGNAGVQNPTSIRHIFELVKQNAKRDLVFFLNQELDSYKRHPFNDYKKKIYGPKKNILYALLHTPIDVKTDKPCFDNQGNPHDGSIYSDTKGAICISAFSIAPKVVRERAWKEVYALILHELSHLFGLDEADADKYQKSILNRFRRYSESTVNSIIKQSKRDTFSSMKLINDLQRDLKSNDFSTNFNRFFMKFRDLIQDFRNIENDLQSNRHNYKLFTSNNSQYHNLRVDILALTLKYLQAHYSKYPKHNLEDYENLFNGKSTV